MASFLGAVRRFLHDHTAGARGPFGQLVQRATKDPELRRRFVAEPAAVLEEHGVQLPDGIEVEVVENTERTIHLVLPPPLEDAS